MLCAGKCTSTARLDGKTIIITGCNTGIGKYTVLDFFRRGGNVIMACRNVQKAEEAREEVLEEAKDKPNLGTIVVKELDLSSLQSIRDFAEKILHEEERIDILINNAGVMMCPESNTADGFEMQFGTNHLGHFLLTLLLLPRIIKSAPSRIVTLSSDAYSLGEMNWDDLNWEKTSYSAMKAYGCSKLANILFTVELAKKLEGTDVTCYSLHPGIVRTDISRHMSETIFPGFQTAFRVLSRPFTKSIEQGAQTQIYCAIDEKSAKESGLYYADCKVVTPSAKARDAEAAKRLWDESWKFVKLENDFNPFEKN